MYVKYDPCAWRILPVWYWFKPEKFQQPWLSVPFEVDHKNKDCIIWPRTVSHPRCRMPAFGRRWQLGSNQTLFQYIWGGEEPRGMNLWFTLARWMGYAPHSANLRLCGRPPWQLGWFLPACGSEEWIGLPRMKRDKSEEMGDDWGARRINCSGFRKTAALSRAEIAEGSFYFTRCRRASARFTSAINRGPN